MSSHVKKINVSEQSSNEELLLNKNYLDVLGNLDVQCQVRIGTFKMTLAELKQLHVEQVLYLDQKTNAPVELLLKDHVIARGELMSYADHFAVKITEVSG